MTLEISVAISVIFYEKTLEISSVILRDCLVKNLIKFDKYCKVDKCSGKIFFFLSIIANWINHSVEKWRFINNIYGVVPKQHRFGKNDRKKYHFYQNWTVLEYDEVF